MSEDLKKLIIIRVDGGICSQMVLVALGLDLSAKGFCVKYDLSFFREHGKDLTGRFVRNWDMPKAFPGLDIPEATPREIEVLKRHCRRRSELTESFAPPLYIDGYPNREKCLIRQVEALKALFRPQTDDATEKLLQFVRSGPTCAIHVRRGDLAKGNLYYGSPTSVEYYRRSMRIVRSLDPGVRFVFFSDEPDWVRSHLLALVPEGSTAVVADANGSDKGYLDLYVISQCEYVISSIGSLGVFGALLSDDNRLLVMSNRQEWALSSCLNVCYLNDDRGAQRASAVDAISAAIPEDKLRGAGWWVYRVWRKLGQWLSGGRVEIGIFPSQLSRC